MYPAVKEVHPQDNYTLSIIFENGEKGVLDMKPLIYLNQRNESMRAIVN